VLGWFGLAVAFKLQAAFAGPFVLAWLLRARVPVRWWPIGPAVTLATLAPAALAGWPIADLLTIYLRQAGSYPQLSLDAPNLGELVRALAGPSAVPFGIAYAAAVGASAGYVGWGWRRLPLGAAAVGPAALSVMIVAGLLPMMHERYFFAADVFALAAALIRRDRIGWAVAALVETGSVLALLAYLTDARGFAAAGAAAMMIATWLLARSLRARPQA
jgi:Gpi18-like mannosyltransferase